MLGTLQGLPVVLSYLVFRVFICLSTAHLSLLQDIFCHTSCVQLLYQLLGNGGNKADRKSAHSAFTQSEDGVSETVLVRVSLDSGQSCNDRS